LVMCPCFDKMENFIHDRKIIAVELLYENLEKWCTNSSIRYLFVK